MADKTGQQIGNYRLIRPLGSGGFAEVYLGQHKDVRSLQAAVKVLHPNLPLAYQEGFLQEAEVIAYLRHPHIIRILDFGVDSDQARYLIMDYASQGTLRNRYPKGTRVPLPTVNSYIKQIAEALEYAHEHNVIHRDLKPENFLLGDDGKILVSDFGIATVVYDTVSMVTGSYAGTVPYSAPEQINGKPRRASDQYSLGIICYEWLTGVRPFTGSIPEIIMQQLSLMPRPLRERNSNISPAVEAVIMQSLAKEYTQRFPSVRAFANALEQACSLPAQKETPIAEPEPHTNTQAGIPTTPDTSQEQERARQAEAERLRQEQEKEARKQVEEWYQAEEARARQEREERARQTKEQWDKEREERARQAEAERRRQAEKEEPRTSVPPSGESSSQGTGASSHPPGNQQFYAGMTSQSTMKTTHVPKRPTTFRIPLLGRKTISQIIALSFVAMAFMFYGFFYVDPLAFPYFFSPYIGFGGTLALSDPLSDNSRGYRWEDSTDDCHFSGGAYHVSSQVGYLMECKASPVFSDFAFEVQMQITKGDCGGLEFREDPEGQGYVFQACKNGTWYLNRYDVQGTITKTLVFNSSPEFTSLNSSNVIAVVAISNTLDLYVNRVKVASVTDSTYSEGAIGLIAISAGAPTEVVYSNALVWTK